MILTAYGFNDILLPRFYNRKKYVLFGILTTLLFYIGSVFDRIVNVHIYEPLTREKPFPQESIIQIFSDVDFLFYSYLTPLLISTFIMTLNRVIEEKHRIEKRNIELERDRRILELQMLKSQINPHFLFNTLNNLYALTLQKSDKAPESIARLSDMLDYMLYQCNDRFVPLHKEVELLQNYIALERLRYGEDIQIEFNNSCNGFIQIAPFILLSIVENAFKHGAGNTLQTPKIQIDISQDGDILYFKVKNTKSDLKINEKNNGIGIINIKQQLDLLYQEHTYRILEESNNYSVDLTINTTLIND
ncbi:histidine kinase [Flavobacteriaceae bacterium AU392]|nr:histidine kinase [Flavobacteriaceae bacterium]RKM84089.1 histidine kinase [Flavobacteriaceae bacterium AU392]